MRDIGETDDENLFEPIRALAEELNRNNILVISTPMWNLTVPYVVKQYIDIVVQPGKPPYYGTNRKLEFLFNPNLDLKFPDYHEFASF